MECPFLLLMSLAFLVGCQRSHESPQQQTMEATAEDALPADSAPALFRDMTDLSGVNCRPRNGEEADHYSILETLGCGLALLDYDGDGLLDLFVCGGGFFQGSEIRGCSNRLYRNLGGWKFEDVTSQTGVDRPVRYTHGCAVADYDRDGWPDLLVTSYQGLMLYHNVPGAEGSRRFDLVTKRAGLRETLWSSSAAWGDVDGDGFPDLYVCHYLNWSFDNNPICTRPSSADHPRDICTPSSFEALPHTLYHNNGDGTFTDVSKRAGLRQHTVDDGKGLGVLMVDVNDDRRPDIFVVNDTTDSLLYVNRGEGRFEERGLVAGVARDDQGYPDGSMGVDAADYDGSGRPSLWVTNFADQLHSLFRNRTSDGREHFRYFSQDAGIARLGRSYVGWGTGFVDVNNDGWEDLVIANGHVLRHVQGGMAQKPVLLENQPHPRRDSERWFANITPRGGSYFRQVHRGRGLVIGDLDNDGYPDLVISHVNEPVTLLRNEADRTRHWLGVELIGRQRRDSVGAKLTLDIDGRRLTRFAKGGASYLSSSDRRLLFGLGASPTAGRLTITWPFGRIEHWDNLKPNRYHRIEEGTGTKKN
jgi:hypothetical protein